MAKALTLTAEPTGVWTSGRAFVAGVFNMGTKTVGVAGSGISALAEHATTLERTTIIDCAATMITHRSTVIHAAAASMVANLEAVHVAKGLKGPFDRNKAYNDCEAKLEANIPA